MNWLKNAVINAQAPKAGVIDMLRQHMGGYAPARSINKVHASDTTKPWFCPRHIALLLLQEQSKKDEYLSTAMEATYGVGRATAKLLVEEWLGPKAVGNWECERCGQQRTMQSKPAAIDCPSKYERHRWEFREPQFESQEYEITGSPDVLVLLGERLIVTELKIMKGEDWQDLIGPLPEHRQRTSLYLKIIADSGSPYAERINLHEARILYVSREYGKKHPLHNEILPFKEFVVKRDDELLHRPLAMARQVKVFRETKAMPSGICGTALDKPARVCTTCQACFSGTYPAAQPALPKP